MHQCALSELFKLESHLGKRFSPGTHLLSGEHVLSHEVFGLLEDSPTFGCLQEQDVFARTSDGAAKKHLKLKKSTWKHGHMGGSFHLLLVKFVSGWNLRVFKLAITLW